MTYNVPSSPSAPCSSCGRDFPHACNGYPPAFPVSPPDPMRPLPGSVRDLAPGNEALRRQVKSAIEEHHRLERRPQSEALVTGELLERLVSVLERLERRLAAVESKS